MIRPIQQGGVFLADLDRAGESAPESLHVWWLGQSGFLVQWGENRLLLDPYLSDSLTRKYAATDKPHVRMTERVVDPSRLSGITVVTASHAHTDHLDPETLVPLVASNPGLRLVFPEAIRGLAAIRSGLPPESLIGLDAPSPGRTVGPGSISEVTVGPVRIRAVPAAHETLDCDPQGRLSCLGFIIRVGSWTLYHSGDTVLFPGLTDSLREERVDLAFLPINGRSPERRVAGNLWGHEAAALAHQAGMGAVVPCHYELFEFNTAPPADFEARCLALQQPYHRLQAGGRLTLEPRSRP
jgi:L-ascorbate metabolism protein UlaG (beta-lactamase superfamily)